MNMPSLKMPFRGGGSEGHPSPAPRIESAVPKAAPLIDTQRQATIDLVSRVQEVAGVQGEEAGLAVLVQAPKAPESTLGVDPKGPGRWARTDIDTAAIDQMGEASAQHAQEQGFVGDDAVPNISAAAVPPVEKARMRFGPNGFTEAPAPSPTAAEPSTDATSAPPEPVPVSVKLPPAEIPELTYGRGVLVESPTGENADAIEAVIGPSITSQRAEQTDKETPVPTLAEIQQKVTTLLNKNNEQYMAMDPKTRAEYLSQAIDTYLQNPDASKLTDQAYRDLAEKIAGGATVTQSEMLKYAIDSTVRMMTDKTDGVMKNLFPSLKNHPELSLVITKVAEKMNGTAQVSKFLSLEDQNALIKASETGKGLFAIIFMLVLTLGKEMLQGGMSDQRQ
jgi:hypothetical protein